VAQVVPETSSAQLVQGKAGKNEERFVLLFELDDDNVDNMDVRVKLNNDLAVCEWEFGGGVCLYVSGCL